ncbi:sulfite exporter TauE/SafE family protein [Serpentinimonas barnesii]|uniref:sulfite exporter TauE/SafE family protein n=1 Tax=Serpentinimonas barnesii TaxID=1458427 RepID=UPI00049837B9|nr:sulfite exporter TauE/SafE family protein [Serpentinimonas barnesii]
MDAWTLTLLLASAGFAAGALNAIAGGGSFLTLPALLVAGLPPIVANATSALAVSPGYLGSTLGFRAELAQLPRRRLLRETLLSAAGGVLGALLLLLTPSEVFRGLIPWLLLFATALFLLGPWLAQRLVRAGAQGEPGWRNPGLLAVATYGGYFNGGLGILLMALYSASGEKNLHTANALKNLNSLVLSLVSVLTFVLAGVIAWGPALLMMAAATAGGYVGARHARRLSMRSVRAVVVCTGLVMSALFFWRG